MIVELSLDFDLNHIFMFYILHDILFFSGKFKKMAKFKFERFICLFIRLMLTPLQEIYFDFSKLHESRDKRSFNLSAQRNVDCSARKWDITWKESFACGWLLAHFVYPIACRIKFIFEVFSNILVIFKRDEYVPFCSCFKGRCRKDWCVYIRLAKIDMSVGKGSKKEDVSSYMAF